jgi:hypothetical protein
MQRTTIALTARALSLSLSHSTAASRVRRCLRRPAPHAYFARRQQLVTPPSNADNIAPAASSSRRGRRLARGQFQPSDRFLVPILCRRSMRRTQQRCGKLPSLNARPGLVSRPKTRPLPSSSATVAPPIRRMHSRARSFVWQPTARPVFSLIVSQLARNL